MSQFVEVISGAPGDIADQVDAFALANTVLFVEPSGEKNKYLVGLDDVGTINQSCTVISGNAEKLQSEVDTILLTEVIDVLILTHFKNNYLVVSH